MNLQPDHADVDPVVTVVHESSGVVAVVKPSGIATQAPPGIDSMEGRMKTWLGRRGGGYLGVPHRLDRPVSGVMLFAVTPRAARQLSRQFERRQVVKRYLARLELLDASQMPGDRWAEWRDRLVKVPDEPRGRVVPAGEPCAEAREAVTRVRLVAELDAASGGGHPAIEVEFEPLTGRMHQLRLQAASRGMPVLGDSLYGSTVPFREGSFRIALHASRIEFIDPDTRVPVVVASPPSW